MSCWSTSNPNGSSYIARLCWKPTLPSRAYIKTALVTIDERLQLPELSHREREAMLAATRYLNQMNEDDVPMAS
ncbi:MAG TPA: hypothetical protein VJO35_09385 [Terriglobales bacterium]|nr:hypothetical protein [Terriglobales bacterium]